MAGNELARILGAEMALDRGFQQVAGLRGDRKHEGDQHQHWGDSKPRELDDDSPAATPPSVPPTAPDQVFFGLTAGHSFGPPIARPTK